MIKKIWNYFRNSIEGTDGKASSKKLSLFAITITMLAYTWKVESEVQLYVFMTHACLFSILIGIMTWSNLATLFKYLLPLKRELNRYKRWSNYSNDDEELNADQPDLETKINDNSINGGSEINQNI